MYRAVSVIFLLAASLCPLFSFSQVIELRPVENLPAETNFTPAYIVANKIRSITANLSNKPDNQVIDDKGLVQRYEFDTLGRMTQLSYTIISGTSTREIEVPALYRKGRIIRKAYTRYEKSYAYDTVTTNFYYDKKSRLVIKRTYANEVYNSVYYTYDSLGNIVKEVRCRETNEGTRIDFRLGIQTVTSMETFEYERTSPTQLKKKCLNDEGRVYRNVIINFDSKGNKTEEYSEYVVTWMNASSKWKYDEKGRVTEKTYSSNSAGDVKLRWTYEYDASGKFVGEKRYKNEVHTNEISYLYDEKGNILKSQIDRDHPNKSIGIVKYSYVYWK
jgi:hypothetical protein